MDTNESRLTSLDSACETLRELLPAYSIGATDEAETHLVESLLVECPEVAADLNDFMRLAGAIVYTAPPMPPPAALHDKLMTAVAQRPTAVSPIMRPIPASKRWMTSTLARFALTAAALLLILNFVLIARLFNLSDEQQQQETEIAQLNEALEQQNQFFAALTTGQAQRIDLHSSDGVALASVIWTPASASALLVSNNLPALATDRAYQLWFILDNQPVSGGLFRVDAQGQGTFIFEVPAPLDKYDALGISDEPMRGSEAPSTTPVALGSA